ncbi:MAG: NTP transferase domain-containing protein, partial [Fimbriimonadaceae bacterium]|nr:NTP transferase domain-containing protein [Alphaproteobacteria bacterium]
MRSRLPKAMHKIAGQPMLSRVLLTAQKAGASDIDVVIGPDMKEVAKLAIATVHGTRIHIQEKRLGTAHAMLSARSALEKTSNEVVVLYGDTPLISEETIQSMRQAVADGADVAVLGFYTSNPNGYGRLITSENGELTAIREQSDASPDELDINFCNSGVMAFNGKRILALLDQISTDNARGEYYLTDSVEIA